MCIDAIDNGVEQYTTSSGKKYNDNTGLANRVARMNLAWNETGDQDARFN